mmetsp:Transcript_12525/g.26334  ORF Transcript_12525/g.26334 Transcript_12525/m.26334 type:complete len:128 (-) Transcript_12525:666-1049(-)
MAEAKSFSRNKSSPWDLWRRASWRSCNDDDDNVASTTRSVVSISFIPSRRPISPCSERRTSSPSRRNRPHCLPRLIPPPQPPPPQTNDKVQQLWEAAQAAHTEAAVAKRRAEELKKKKAEEAKKRAT